MFIIKYECQNGEYGYGEAEEHKDYWLQYRWNAKIPKSIVVDVIEIKTSGGVWTPKGGRE